MREGGRDKDRNRERQTERDTHTETEGRRQTETEKGGGERGGRGVFTSCLTHYVTPVSGAWSQTNSTRNLV